jgi:hypothetical protein
LCLLYAQQHLLGGQGDRTIYDPADFVYAPCFGGRMVSGDGAPLAVDDVIANTVVPAADLGWLNGTPAQPKAAPHTPQQAANLASRFTDWTVGSGVDVSNPDLCSPSWLADYGGGGRSHNADIGAIMARIWKRCGGRLGVGEMSALYDQVDALAGMYCQRKYGDANKMNRISRIMRDIATTPNAEQERQIEDDLLASRLRTLRNRAPANPTLVCEDPS